MQKKKTESWVIGYLKSLQPTGKPLWLSWVSILCSFWLVLYPVPREPLFILVLILPVLGLIINRVLFSKFDSLLLVVPYYGKEMHYVASFIFFPAFALTLRCVAYHCADFFKVFEIGSAGFVLLLLFLFTLYGFIEKTNPERIGMYLFVIPVVALYSYAAVYIINCEFDNTKPLTFEAKITDKYSQTGKNSGYYLTVDGWEKHSSSDDVKVSYAKYDSLKIGQQIKIKYRKGLLNIPWYHYLIE